jgi:hypothetical protein
MEELTQEEKLKSVAAAFDSVQLIQALNAKGSLTEEEQGTKDRNIEHLNVMLTKEWFGETLTKSQKTQILAVI